MRADVDLVVFEENARMPAALQQQALELFRTEYFKYHYIGHIADERRVRLCALRLDRLVGFASFRITGAYAYYANLLVRSSERGQGIGGLLESRRFELARARRKKVYVSCVCDTIASQKLKSELELTPGSVKYGYRVSTIAEAHVGSAVVFSEPPFLIVTPQAFRVQVSQEHGRARIFSPEGAVSPSLLEWIRNCYTEIMVGPDGAARLMGSAYAYSGVDLDMETGRWHYCFQVRNLRYRTGLLAQPRQIVSPAALRRLLPEPVVNA